MALEYKSEGQLLLFQSSGLKYIANVQNKVNVCTFLADTWYEFGVKHLLDGQQIVIGGDFKDAQKSVMITSGHLVALKP